MAGQHDHNERANHGLPQEFWQQVDACVKPFEEQWEKGGRPVIDDFLPRNGDERLRHAVLESLVKVEMERRRAIGEAPQREEYVKRYRQLHAEETFTRATVIQPASPPLPRKGEPIPLPKRIGRYPVEWHLGRGGFGDVYLARDDILNRLVAIKVPRRDVVAGPGDAAPYRQEAQMVAQLDHPNIVPVYDVGSTDEHPFFVVSKFIEGCTLSQRLKDKPPSVLDATRLVSTVAETLHYAHRQGLFHRDIKPSNILLDYRSGDTPVPYIADFGLALKEQDIGHGPGFAGTPSYMSPEQARGEGNRVDGRSDIFSLGIVLYELLTGKRPFHAEDTDEILDQIKHMEVRPPRQLADVPKELERICLKALAKRITDRYATAKDFAEDLRFFLQHAPEEERQVLDSRIAPETAPPPPSLPSRPLKIVPHGLRSFDARDGVFFLELLPGPRDRDELPETISFWKTRVEETDADNTFAVGVVYGPSGCGKSSLVKAGLLPRLSEQVLSLYVEATAEDTETRLLNGLRKRVGRQGNGALAGLGLKDTLKNLRRGHGLETGKKLLIVLDQFEQWLHGSKDQETTELVEALRQCDGGRVQCLILVRDDFWLALSRFLKALEIRLLEAQNSALVDLFDVDHARKVLAAFGRAFGKLPESPAEMSTEQKLFLTRAVAELAQDGKVICVRLALFAEMIKGKPWTPASLRAMGGATGVGATFLEETFSAATAPPEHRYHQKAARAVLQALAPQTGTDIKGHMKSRQALLAVSGYAGRPRDFADLLRILDNELRLITPTDPEGVASDEERAEGETRAPAAGASPSAPSGQPALPAAHYFQLTHDYLVHSLRDWLTRKQKESRRGRAELLLAEKASDFTARPESRRLPSLLQWLQICLLTQRRRWTPAQRQLMHRATRYHATRLAVAVLLVLIVLIFAVRMHYGNQEKHAEQLVTQLLGSRSERVPAIIREIDAYEIWADPLLGKANARADDESSQKLYTSLALLPRNPDQVPYLYERLLKADPRDVILIRDELLARGHDAGLQPKLWTLLGNPVEDPERRLRAACALAGFCPNEQMRWQQASRGVAQLLGNQKGVLWTDALRGVSKRLLDPLADLFLDDSRNTTERGWIATAYGRLAAEVPDGYARLEQQLQEPIAGAAEKEQVALAKKRTRIAAALIVMARASNAWTVLQHTPDPTARSLLIEELNPSSGVQSRMLIARLHAEPDITVRRALLLCLGNFSREDSFLPDLERLYCDHVDAGIHGAAAWLLDRWQQEPRRRELDKQLMKRKPGGPHRWYIDSLGQTMTIIPRPGTFLMGEGASRLRCTINRSFAIAAHEVTLAEFQKVFPAHVNKKGADPNCPAGNMSWFMAAQYCNWLSKKAGLAPCYEPYQGNEFNEKMKMAKGYLGRPGYRLATDAEWEYACRAGAETLYSFGNSKTVLEAYAWSFPYSKSMLQPVGLLKPNDFGLFDMHGNAMEWTQGRFDRPKEVVEAGWMDDREDAEDVKMVGKAQRVLRGGSVITTGDNFERCGKRTSRLPSGADALHGFRVAQTIDAQKQFTIP